MASVGFVAGIYRSWGGRNPGRVLCERFLAVLCVGIVCPCIRSHGNLCRVCRVFGMAALVSVPVLFCMGAFAFSSSLRLAAGVLGNRQAGLFPREKLLGLIPCGVLLLLAVFVQWSVMPQLLLAVSKLMTAA